jgi:hypothetical protein
MISFYQLSIRLSRGCIFCRPESIISEKRRNFISDNLRNTDSALAGRISGAVNEINVAATEVARTTQPAGPPHKKPRTSEQCSEAHQ